MSAAYIELDSPPHGSAEWVKDRRNYLGGGDAGPIAGLSPHKTKLGVFHEKKGTAPPVVDNENMEWGRLLEKPVADKWFMEQRKKGGICRMNYSPPTFQSVDHSFMRANVDAMIETDEGPGVLEVKTADKDQAFKWGDAEDAVPTQYFMQGLHYMAVTGVEYCIFALLLGGNRYKTYKIRRDESSIANLIQIESDFWEKLQANIEPAPVIGNEKDLKLKYGIDDGSEFIASPVNQNRIVSLKAVKEEIKRLEKAETELKQKIQFEMGAHAILKDSQNNILATWKSHDQNRLDTTLFRSEHPKIAAEFTVSSKVRKFLVK